MNNINSKNNIIKIILSYVMNAHEYISKEYNII